MVLNDEQITEAVESKQITLDPFDSTAVEPASYDLRVGDEGITTSSKRIINLEQIGFLIMEPGDFAIVLSHEFLQTDAWHIARIGLTSSYARKGIVATIGPQLDPGYRGKLVVHLYNLSPRRVSLPFGDKFITLEFHRLDRPASRLYDGPYQGKTKLGPDEIRAVTETEAMPLSEVLTSLRTMTSTVTSLSNDVSTLTSNVRDFTTNTTTLTSKLESLATQFANSTSELKNNLTQLTSRLDDLATSFAEMSGQLKGSRWIQPVLVSVIIALAGVIVSAFIAFMLRSH